MTIGSRAVPLRSGLVSLYLERANAWGRATNNRTNMFGQYVVEFDDFEKLKSYAYSWARNGQQVECSN